MKKTNLTRSLLAACSIVALSAVMYGCSSSGEDEERSRATMAEEMLAALAAAAGLPDGTALTTEHIQQAAQALADSQAEVARLTGELDTANDRVVALLADLATANASIADLTQDLADANAEATRLEGELSDAIDEVTRLTGELSTANADVTRLTGELATANADNSRLMGELGMANTQIAGLMDDLAMANAQIESLGDDLAMANSDLADARQDLADAQADLAAARMQNTMDAATIAGLEDRVAALQGQVDMKDMQIATMTGQIGDLNNTIDGLNNTIAGLNSQIDDLNAQIGDKNTEIANLNAQILSKEAEIAGLNTQVSNKDTEISNKNTEISNKNAEIANLNTQIANKNTEINGLNDDIDDLNDDIDDLKSQIASKDGVISELRAQLAAAGGEADHFRARQVAMHLSPFTDTDDDGVRDPDGVGLVHEIPLPYLAARAASGDITERTASEQILAHVRVSPDGNHVVDNDESDETVSGYAPTAAPPALTDELATWRGRGMQQELPGGTSNIVYAYSDIEGSTREMFKDAYGKLDVGGLTRLTYLQAVGTTYDTEEEALAQYDEDVAEQLMTLESDDFVMMVGPGKASYQGAPELDAAGSQAAFWGLVAATNVFPAKPGAGIDSSRDYTVNDSFRGMLDGVPGTFTCTAATTPDTACTVTHSEEDGLLSDDTWRFVANDADESSNADDYVTTMRPDGDYLVLGWWLLKPDDEEGTHDFAPFSAGRDPVNQSGDVNSPTGEATYTGPAAGKYVTRPRGSSEADIGIFRAKAELMADFGDNATPGSISGTVSEFVDANNSSLGNWNVVLKGAATADAATTIGAAGDFTGNVVATDSRAGGREWESGYWAGQLYGNGGDYPTSIAGTFHAMWGSANPRDEDDTMPEVGYVGVAGAFGTHYVEPDDNN